MDVASGALNSVVSNSGLSINETYLYGACE